MLFSCLSFVVYASFDEYIAVETLDGDNKYDAGEYGMQVRDLLSFIVAFDEAGSSKFLSYLLGLRLKFKGFIKNPLLDTISHVLFSCCLSLFRLMIKTYTSISQRGWHCPQLGIQ